MFPLVRIDERKLAPSYRGLVVTCDVDKTYLDTDFESLAGLLRVPLEYAEDKRTVAGMAPVLRELRHGPDARSRQTPFYFLTASPPALVKELFRKTLIDAVQADGVTCKDWNTVLFKKRRPAWIRRQIAYKLCALLHQRALLPAGASEILIGDNAEADADAYALYADVESGRVTADELDIALARHGCDADERRFVAEAMKAIEPSAGRVENIYILMARAGTGDEFAAFGPRLIPCHGPFQLALHLVLTGRARDTLPAATARELLERRRATRAGLSDQCADGVERGLWTVKAIRPIHTALADANLTTPPPARYPTRRRRPNSDRDRWSPRV